VRAIPLRALKAGRKRRRVEVKGSARAEVPEECLLSCSTTTMLGGYDYDIPTILAIVGIGWYSLFIAIGTLGCVTA
jgi:hypothetical protein